MAYDQKLHQKFLNTANKLENTLKKMAEPSKGDPGEAYGAHKARKLAKDAISRAFGKILDYERVPDKTMKELLPQIEGASKIAKSLFVAGVKFPLPIIHQIVVEVARALRRKGL